MGLEKISGRFFAFKEESYQASSIPLIIAVSKIVLGLVISDC